MNPLRALFFASAMLAIGSVASAVLTEVDVTVPAGASETPIASFHTPAGVVSSEVVVGRFLIDYPKPASLSDEIIVQVQTHDLTQGRFKWAAVTLNDPVSLGSLEDLDKRPAAADRVIADLFVCEVPSVVGAPPPYCQGVDAIAAASTHRLIEIRVIFSSDYTFDSGPHIWTIRVFGVAGTAVRYSGFNEESSDLAAARAVVTKPKIGVSPGTLAFGEVQINLTEDQTPRQKFMWTNEGTDLFTPTGNLSEGVPMPFYLHGSPAFVALNPGETSSEAYAGFWPKDLGLVAKTLEIRGTGNSAGEVVGTAELSGTGIDLTQPEPLLPPSNLRVVP